MIIEINLGEVLEKMKKTLILFIAIFTLLVSCSMAGMLEKVEDTSRFVEYEITGTASSVGVVFAGRNFTISTLSNQTLPFNHSFTSEKGGLVSLAGINEGGSGTVVPSIFVDGEVFEDAETTITPASSTSLGIVTIQGILE